MPSGFRPPPPPPQFPKATAATSSRSSDRPDRSDRSDRSDRHERNERNERSDRYERHDKDRGSSKSSSDLKKEKIAPEETKVEVKSRSGSVSSTVTVEPSATAIKIKEVKEEFVPLKWALEDPSVLVSRRLAGTELYERVLALRGITKELAAEETDTPPELADVPASSSEGGCKEESTGPTLDEMLASITQQNEEEGNVDQRAAVSVDDFFGAFQGDKCLFFFHFLC
jgi:hypothetical protein